MTAYYWKEGQKEKKFELERRNEEGFNFKKFKFNLNSRGRCIREYP